MESKKRIGVMLDCSRNAVMRPSAVKNYMDILSKMGYNMLMLYTEDTYEVEGEPFFGYLRGRYSENELKDIADYGEQVGIEVIPCIQTLAHLNQIFRWSCYKSINDTEDILLADCDRTYELIEKMFKSIRRCFKTDIVHIGMDEAHNVGLGKYFKEHGLADRFSLLSRHLKRVSEIAERYGFKPIMWSDMFFRLANGGDYCCSSPDIVTKDIAALVPENVSLVYWDYYTREKNKYDVMIEAHKRFNKPVWFAGGAWMWKGFSPDNEISIKRTRLAMQSCRDNNVDNIFMTCWGDNGAEASYYSVMPTLYYAVSVLKGIEDEQEIRSGFFDMFGIKFDDYMKLDLPSKLREKSHDAVYNPDKLMFYSDPFLGIYDHSFEGDGSREEDMYRSYADELDKLKDAPKFGYLFETAAALCKFLSYKYALGRKTRSAYGQKNRSALKELLGTYDKCVETLDVFYDAFRKQWYKEKKGNGFEVQDVRIGGLKQRLISCRSRLSDYICGRIECIEELEEQLIDLGDTGLVNCWSRWTPAVL